MAKGTGLTFTQISQMSVSQLGRALTSGQVSRKWLKSYYTTARKKAMSRYSRIKNTTEFGTIEPEHFTRLRNIVTDHQLLREIVDVSKYLNSGRSTIKGLKAIREEWLDTAHSHGYDFVTEDNYGEFIDFLQWFKASEFSKYYDSHDEEFKSVFEDAESANPADWKRLFAYYNKRRKGKGKGIKKVNIKGGKRK